MTLTGMIRPLIIGIAGCSGSGKTTLSRELARELDATLFTFDYYYRDLAHLPIEERAVHNFDHPDSLESDLLLQHVTTLAASHPVERPVYDFSTHTRVPDKTDPVEPARVIIVEGILALHYTELRALFDFSVYVDTPHDVCLARRTYRDVRERGRTEAMVLEQFNSTTRPMADLFVIPSKAHASVVVDGTESLDWSVERVLTMLHCRKLWSPPPATAEAVQA